MDSQDGKAIAPADGRQAHVDSRWCALQRVGLGLGLAGVLVTDSAAAQTPGPGPAPAPAPARTPAPPPLASAEAPLVLRGVTVIDVRRGRHLPDRTVVIVGTRIRALNRTGRVRVPAGAQVVDARGKYLIPGLWDMHVHPQEFADVAYPLFIANGVTGVRDAGSRVPLATLSQWKREIAQGTRVGPRMLVSGPSLMGTWAGARPNTMSVVSDSAAAVDAVRGYWKPGWDSRHALYVPPAAVRRVVDSLKAAGADMLKIYGPTHEIRLAIIAEAKRLGMRFGGHAAEDMTGPEFADSGATFVDHSASLGELVCGENSALASFDGPRCAAAIQRFWRNHTWITVLASFQLTERREALARRYEPDSLTYAWLLERLREYPAVRGDTLRLDSVAAAQNAASSAEWEAVLVARDTANRGFGADAGRPVADSLRKYHIRFPLVIGSDIMLGIQSWLLPVPGFSVHDVLFELARTQRIPAGFASYAQRSTLGALQVATLNPALALAATDSLGTVEAGKLADLVLLDADPLQDIWHTRRIRAVIANGRYYDRAALDGLLAAAHQAALTYRLHQNRQ